MFIYLTERKCSRAAVIGFASATFPTAAATAAATRERVYLLKFYPQLLAAAGARMGVEFLAAPKARGTCSHRRRQSRRSKLNSHVNTNNCSWATASRHLDFEWAAVAPSRADYARAKIQTGLQLNEMMPHQNCNFQGSLKFFSFINLKEGLLFKV